jgi:uncharacterized protein
MIIEAQHLLLTACIFIAAMLYSSVGHAGASGYLAAMALFGIAPEVMKPTALALNILVATIATFKFYRVGAFSWKLFLPLALASAPCAYLGGLISLPGNIYKPLVGVILVYAAGYSFYSAKNTGNLLVKTAALPLLVFSGALLGLLSGLTGVGGGIFLSPLLLFMRWAETRTISGIAAAFILVNSIAGLLGVISTTNTLPQALPWWMLAVIIGGYIGAEIGSKYLNNAKIRKLLAVVLLIAGVKMILA